MQCSECARRRTLIVKWSGWSAVSLAVFWSLWHVSAGSLPALDSVRITGEWTLKLPFAVSRGWDILAAPVWAAVLVCLFTSGRLRGDPGLARAVRFGLAAGVILGLSLGPIAGLAIGLFLGVAADFLFGCAAGLPIGLIMGASVAIGFGLGYGLGYGLAVGLGFSLVYGLAVALIALTGFGLGAGVSLAAGWIASSIRSCLRR